MSGAETDLAWEGGTPVLEEGGLVVVAMVEPTRRVPNLHTGLQWLLKAAAQH